MQEQGQRHQNEPTGDPVEYAMVDGVESSALIKKSENDGIAIVERR